MFQELMPLLAQRLLIVTLSRISEEEVRTQRYSEAAETRSAG